MSLIIYYMNGDEPSCKYSIPQNSQNYCIIYSIVEVLCESIKEL